MNIIFSREIDTVLKIGKSLDGIGINNWALNKKQVLFALKKFSLLKVPILGGDIYESKKGTIQTTYDNWYCDPLPGETKEEFVTRSIAKSKAYIEAYKGKEFQKLLFALVPDVLDEN